jgi:hypothetical protein
MAMRRHLILLTGALTGCSLFTSLSGLSGGEAIQTDAGADSAAGTDSAAGADAGGPSPADAAKDVVCFRQTAGPRGATIVSSTLDGGSQWSMFEGALQPNDGKEATVAFLSVGEVSQHLLLMGFGFSLPPSAVVLGVSARFLRYASGVSIRDKDVSLVVGGTPAGESRPEAVDWPLSVTPREYGGPDDRWGIALTRDTVSSNDFGVALSAELVTATGGASYAAYVDDVRVTISYCEP